MKSLTPWLFFSLLLVLMSCGGKERPSGSDVNAYMEKLALRIDLSEKAYDSYVNLIPEEHNLVTKGLTITLHKEMMTALNEEKRLLDEIEVLDSDEETKDDLKALKEAALDIVNTYIDGGGKELNSVKRFVSNGKTIGSNEVVNELNAFEVRIQKKYEAYGQIQKKLAAEFDISLY